MDTIKPDLLGISESDPCYYIIKYNTDADSVLFCQYTRGKWSSRQLKDILPNEGICNDIFEAYNDFTLHKLNDTSTWNFMKDCIENYTTTYSMIESSKHNSSTQNETSNRPKMTIRQVMRFFIIFTKLVLISLTETLSNLEYVVDNFDFCPVMEKGFNTLVTITKVMSFGTSDIEFVNLCCGKPSSCIPKIGK